MHKKYLVQFVAMVAMFLGVSGHQVQAHPHAWIDLQSTLLFDDQGAIEGLRVGWLFDDFYSVYALERMKQDAEGNFNQEDLDDLAKVNIENLAGFSYFTFIQVNQEPVTYKPVTTYNTHVAGHRLWLEFEVMLEKPVDPSKVDVDYAIYDPTFYIEILYAEDGLPIQFSGEASSGCGYNLVKPTPPADLGIRLAALDKTETADVGVGKLFAEKIEVQCD